MAITGVTEQQYRDYLKHGGNFTFEIDATDIDASGCFENSPLIAPLLSSGFELKPSSIIEEAKDMAQLLLHGDPWMRIVTRTYLQGGSVIYRKIATGRYEAKVSAPLTTKPIISEDIKF